MPTPVDFPNEFKRMYREIKAQERRERRRSELWDNVFKFACIGGILAFGLALWMVTPR